MKVEFKRTTETIETVELSTPFYTKSNCHFYKVIDESNCIQVCTLKGHESICFSSLSSALKEREAKESEFNSAYKDVLNRLNVVFKVKR